MSADDHRSRAAPITGALAAGLWPATRSRPSPGSPARRPARAAARCGRRSGVEDRTAQRARLRAHLRRRPPPARAPRRCSRCSPASGVRGDLLPGRRAGPPRNPALVGELLAAGPRDRACTATATATCCGSRRGRCARTSPAREDAIEAATGRSPDALPPALRRAQRRRAALARGAAGARCCGAAGAATGRRAPRPSRSPSARRPTAPRAGSVLLLHDADDYSAPGSWRRTAAALPRVLEHAAPRAGWRRAPP